MQSISFVVTIIPSISTSKSKSSHGVSTSTDSLELERYSRQLHHLGLTPLILTKGTMWSKLLEESTIVWQEHVMDLCTAGDEMMKDSVGKVISLENSKRRGRLMRR